jgi:hypothetical protein
MCLAAHVLLHGGHNGLATNIVRSKEALVGLALLAPVLRTQRVLALEEVQVVDPVPNLQGVGASDGQHDAVLGGIVRNEAIKGVGEGALCYDRTVGHSRIALARAAAPVLNAVAYAGVRGVSRWEERGEKRRLLGREGGA